MTEQTTDQETPLNGALFNSLVDAFSGWEQVVYAHDCFPCEMCDEPVCPKCQVHYADCDCPGPSQDDEYEYKGFNGIEYARRLTDA